MMKIALADDQALVLHGLRALLESLDPTGAQLGQAGLLRIVRELDTSQPASLIAERSEPNVEDLEEDDHALVGVHLEAALEEVRAILEGAQEDVRGILGGEGVAS